MVEGGILSEVEFGSAYTSGFFVTSRYLQSKGIYRELAEEIAQEAWCRGWQRKSELRDSHALVNWINTIAKHLMYRHFSNQRRYESASTFTELAADFETPIIALEVVDCCQEQDRDVLVRFYMEGYSSEEIATSLGLQPSTVRVRILRAKRKLRELASYAIHTPVDGQAGRIAV